MVESKKRIISDIVTGDQKPITKRKTVVRPAEPSAPEVVAPAEAATSVPEKVAAANRRIGPKPRKFDSAQLNFLRKGTDAAKSSSSTLKMPSMPKVNVSGGSKIPGKKFLVASASLIVIILVYVALTIFGSATVEITAKESQFKLSRPVTFTLPYEEISVSESRKQTGKSVNVEEVNQKAHGEIAIFNAFSSSSQVLVVNTRFRTKEGNIYRIGEQITVPGATVVNGEITPSKIIVEVVSDNEGEEYNVAKGVTFDIPGFVGSPRYEGFYGESVEAIDGGYVGEVKIVGQSEADAALATATAEATSAANNILRDSVPAGLIALPEEEIKVTKSSVNPDIGDPGEEFVAEATATGSFVLINEEELLGKLEELLFDDFPKDKNNLELIDNAGITLINKNSSTGEAIFELQNTINVAWRAEKDSLTNNLSEAKIKDIPEIFKNYESILSAEVRFSPSWWRRIPGSAERINVEYR